MRFQLFVALAFLATAASYCHCLNVEDGLPTNDISTSDVLDVEDEYVVETLKNISSNLKDRVIALVDRIIQTGSEIKEVSKKGGEDVKAHLKELWRELAQSRDQLKTKLGELFTPSQYSGETGLQEKLRPFRSIRERLQRVLAQLKEGSANKLKRFWEILRDIYKEIKTKLVQYRKSGPAQYSQDVTSSETPYIIDTLKELKLTLKGKLRELVDKIKVKSAEVKTVLGDKAREVREQLKALREQLAATRKNVLGKVRDIFKPSQYGTGDFVQETLRPLHEKFQKFLKQSKEVTEENADKLKAVLRELRSEIKVVLKTLQRRKPEVYTTEGDATQDVQAYEKANSILHDELLDIVTKLESLEANENPDQEAIQEQLRRLDNFKSRLIAIQQPSEPAKYFLKPALERMYEIFLDSTTKLQEIVTKVKKAAAVLTEGARNATHHAKHSFGRIKEIIGRGRDEINKKISGSLNQQDDVTIEDSDIYSTTGGIEESYSTTSAYWTAVTTDDNTGEAHSTTLEAHTSPTEASYAGFADPTEFERQ